MDKCLGCKHLEKEINGCMGQCRTEQTTINESKSTEQK